MKKRTIWIGAAGVVLVAGAAIGGPMVYAAMQDDAPPPLSVESDADADTGADEDADLDGTWTVGDGSQAGYRVEEVLNGQDVTVVGRTDEVSGEVTVADGALSAASVEVDVASVATDDDRRDDYFRGGRAMDVASHPTATITVDEPTVLPDLSSGEQALEGTATLELAGESREVDVTYEVARTADGVAVSGSIPVTFKDFGIGAPDLGFVKVEDTGTVEFLVNLEPAA